MTMSKATKENLKKGLIGMSMIIFLLIIIVVIVETIISFRALYGGGINIQAAIAVIPDTTPREWGKVFKYGINVMKKAISSTWPGKHQFIMAVSIITAVPGAYKCVEIVRNRWKNR